MKYILLLLLILGSSCYEKYTDITKLPIVESGFGDIHDGSEYMSRIDFRGTRIHNYLRNENLRRTDLFGIAMYKIHEMDSNTMRQFDLCIFESHLKNDVKWHILTVSKVDGEVIDEYSFNPDSLEIRLVYPHSSKLDHDGIAMELLESGNGRDSIIINKHYLEVFETGEIRYISKSSASTEIFKVLKASQLNTGKYMYHDGNINILLELKDGMSVDNYSYNLDIYTPEGCIHNYLCLDCEMVDGTLYVGDTGDFQLSINNNEILVKNDNFESACEENLKFNYKLKKTDDNKR